MSTSSIASSNYDKHTTLSLVEITMKSSGHITVLTIDRKKAIKTPHPISMQQHVVDGIKQMEDE